MSCLNLAEMLPHRAADPQRKASQALSFNQQSCNIMWMKSFTIRDNKRECDAMDIWLKNAYREKGLSDHSVHQHRLNI